MKELIGFNIVCFVVSTFIILTVCIDLDIKDKIIGMIIEVVLMALLTLGVELMC